ncbi:uncharacterized protein [Venturia canescens]|uniref:uncharacterized protein isoform X2 n=1 Tax=Venturia canescens TaxID=32260 RepID=UPI001C9C70BD|nr:uncharacterized protein LOC122405788 isoform X2 [Venturia canescens]
MIGPPSGSNGMPTHQVVDNPVRVKRKVFEDLDIESLCEEVCQNGKKRFLNELREPVDTTIIQNLVDPTEFSSPSSASSTSSSPGSSVQEITNVGGSVARLEVLVVDGTWDPSSLGNAEFTDISSSIGNDSEIPTLDDVKSIENGYGAILSYWEPTDASETTQNPTNATENPVTPAPRTPLSTTTTSSTLPVEDQENGNLSWLLDFKLDSFIEAPEERTIFPPVKDNHIGNRNRCNANASRANVTTSGTNEAKKSNINHQENETVVSSASPVQNEVMRHPTIVSANYGAENRSYAASRYGGPKKPPFTYTELIEQALQERGELTVSAIYSWISEHFPYYKSNDDRWKNSVRHNLSINPHFRKGSKAPHGAGHLWAIANRGDTQPRQLITTNGTILPMPRQFIKNLGENGSRKQSNVNSQMVTFDEVAAATASISQPEEINLVTTSVTLEHCAEQILNGVKREVEVQYLVPMVVPANEPEPETVQTQKTESNEPPCPDKETDFLNPVSKEEVAEECGLIGEGYLVTDLNPTALGLNMVEPEIITPDNLFGEELSFQFYELTSPSQLQSA